MAEMSARARASTPVRWLDVCCGSGRAPAEAARLLADRGATAQAEITGLEDHFVSGHLPPFLRLTSGSVTEWAPDGRFDLITCVHGLHYVGDKLGVLSRIASWLTSDGLFIANFDARSIRRADGKGLCAPTLRQPCTTHVQTPRSHSNPIRVSRTPR
ncbi:class I SAM-dependent methyltransferase [Spirillospora sp. CA-142024]|uniref:class I SAM-dependent methyltransferase n=1 Tax=Spirillospora sp. CA-142024 TaxID=3240036 RepID=UPI003D8AD557